MSRPSGRRDETTPPDGDALRAAVRPRARLPGRRPSRRPVEVDGVDASLQPLIDRAVTDLADRVGVPPDEVVVEVAASVTWSDSSCGCPQPDRSYAQGPVDGAYVRLRAGGRVFHFHGGGGRPIFLCDG
ncbi:hypothetical protein [Phycicoccus sp. Root101]|uniref:hypothetical protein n=1 Tax=Phycicoccus sp. Root101 TaxID=1736421 RepID=UPI0012F738D6|nr:hypothetical protein [Phycicoccus sp. Root101]